MSRALEEHLRRQFEHSRRFFWHRLRWRAVRKYVPGDAPLRLVDVGAGAGLLGEYVTKDRPNVAYEFAEPIESLRADLRQRFGEQADATDRASFGDARVVTLLDVLEHQEDDRLFFEQLVAKMAPGSQLLLTVPANQRLWSEWDVALGHFRRYDKASLAACCKGLPLDVQEISYLFPEMVPMGKLRARRSRKGKLEVTEDSAEFPDLPAIANDVLYGVGSLSLDLRRHSPLGTSVFLAARVRDSAG